MVTNSPSFFLSFSLFLNMKNANQSADGDKPILYSLSSHSGFPSSISKDQTDHTRQELDSDHVLLCVFLGWIFTEVIPPLIATCFYATEGEGTGSRVLYYRKEEWEVLRGLGEAQMRSHFIKVNITINETCLRR